MTDVEVCLNAGIQYLPTMLASISFGMIGVEYFDQNTWTAVIYHDCFKVINLSSCIHTYLAEHRKDSPFTSFFKNFLTYAEAIKAFNKALIQMASEIPPVGGFDRLNQDFLNPSKASLTLVDSFCRWVQLIHDALPLEYRQQLVKHV
jgi:hypothetical protein